MASGQHPQGNRSLQRWLHFWGMPLMVDECLRCLLTIGCSSHQGTPGTQCHVEDVHTENLHQEDVTAQERSSASTLTVEKEKHETLSIPMSLGTLNHFPRYVAPVMLQEPLGFLPFRTRMLRKTGSPARLMLYCLCSLIALLSWLKKK